VALRQAVPREEEADLGPRVSPWILILAVVAIGVAVTLFVMLAPSDSNNNDQNGPPLPAAERQAIERADCTALVQLEDRYTPNSDVEPDATALNLTRERIAKLHCPPR
jgi:hypothetical protein